MSREIGSEATVSPSYHNGDLPSALLAATVELVQDGGLDAVTLRAVARRVGVSEAAPYHHFANKAELLAGAAVVAFDTFGETLAEAVRTSREKGQDAALGAAVGYITFGLAHPGEYQLIFGRHISELGLDTRTELQAAGAATISIAIDALEESLARRRRSVGAEEVFPLVRSLLHGIVDLMQQREFGPEPDLDEAIALATRGLDALLQGLQPQTKLDTPLT